MTRGRERLTARGRARLAAAFGADPADELEAALLAKEAFRDLYEAPDRRTAHRALVAWYFLVADYDVDELTTFATTVSRWGTEILNYFDAGLTNGPTEGRNLTVKAVEHRGLGFRNFANYRLRVLYACG